MGLLDKLRFGSQSQGLSASADSGKAKTIPIFEETAISQLVVYLTQLPDLDETLVKAGVGRDQLRKLLSDDEIQQAVETRQDALLATPWFLSTEQGKPDQFLTDQLTEFMQEIMLGAVQARWYGYSVLEATYKLMDGGKIGFDFIGEKPFEWFEPKSDGRLIYYPDDGSGGAQGIEVDQTVKFFLTRAHPTYRLPRGEALLSRLYWPWYFRQNGWKFWAKFLERFGAPLLVGKSNDTQAMVNALLMAHSQSVIGIDRNDSVETIGTNAGASSTAFEGFETAIIRRIQKLVLGQTLTSGTDGGSGNKALGQVHDSVRQDKRYSDIKLITSTVQRVVDALCTLNELPKHTIKFSDGASLEADRAVRDKDLFTVGVRFDPSYITKAYGLDASDFTINPDAPAINPSSAPNNAPKLKASQLLTFSQAADSENAVEFTPVQQEIELVADGLLASPLLPINDKEIKAAIFAATSPEDLADRLFAVIGDGVSHTEFTQHVERALMVADMIGYTSATIGTQ
jgi:phage gp29-like protein